MSYNASALTAEVALSATSLLDTECMANPVDQIAFHLLFIACAAISNITPTRKRK